MDHKSELTEASLARDLNNDATTQILDRELLSFDPSRNISIHVLEKEELERCSFWLGIFKSGDLSPLKLMESSQVAEVFLRAATEGLSESDAVLISDNSSKDPEAQRMFYFVPEPSWQAQGSTDWVQSVAKTISQLKIKQVGIFFSPGIFDKETSRSNLIQLLKFLIKGSAVREYHLYPGAHGTNIILNSALAVKTDLESELSKIFVFH